MHINTRIRLTQGCLRAEAVHEAQHFRQVQEVSCGDQVAGREHQDPRQMRDRHGMCTLEHNHNLV